MSEVKKQAGPVQIGDWILVTELNLLKRAGQEVRLEPRHADLLVFMSARRGEVVSTEDIIQNVWDGQVVTDHSVYQAIAKLRKAVGDNASKPLYIETVPKRGYRLIAEVSEIRAEPMATLASTQPEVKASLTGAGIKRHWMSAALVLVIALFAVWWILPGTVGVIAPAYRTVAVLPFATLSERETDRFIAEGFSIELANALGRSKQARVIGPISTQLAATLGNSLPEIGHHLDADIVVHGTLRHLNDKLSVSGTLTEVASGHQLWSEVFDRNAKDILAVQREVAKAVAGAMQQELEADASTPPPHMLPRDTQVYDYYLLGRYYRTQRTQKDLERALDYFGKALQFNPDHLPANRGMAGAHLLLSFYGNEPLSKALENAQPFLGHALELAPDDAELQALIGLSHYLKGAPGLAEEFLMRAVATHPNLVEGWMWLGLTRQQQGRLRDSLAPLEHANNLEPLMVTTVVNYANALSWHGKDDEAIALLDGLATTVEQTSENSAQLYRVLASVHRSQGNLVDAYVWAARALDAAPDSALSRANMAIALGLLGDMDQAAEMARVAYGQSAPGRGIMDYLARGTVILPGLLPKDLIEARLADLQHLPDIPEIEWRMANLDVGMLAYYDGELGKATAKLRKALDGRTYPIGRTDDDIFVCISLADALGRSGLSPEAEDQLVRCEEDLENANEQGWNSLSLAASRVRLAVLRGDHQAGHQLLEALFNRGFRGLQLMQTDPILKSLEQSKVYQQGLAKAVGAVDAAKKEISTAGKN